MIYEYIYNIDGQELKWPVNIDTLPYRIDTLTANESLYLNVSDTAIFMYYEILHCLQSLHVSVLKSNDTLVNSSTCMSNPKLKDRIYLLDGDTLLYNWVEVSDCETNSGYDSTNLRVTLKKMIFLRYKDKIPILDYPKCDEIYR